MKTFEELVAEGVAESTDGWSFAWFDGRATEERPPWGYARLAAQAIGAAASVLDVQTGGGEVFAAALADATRRPARIAATEGWAPNLAIARRNLTPFGGAVVDVDEAGPLPFADSSFELVVSRHPHGVVWGEIARVLAPGGIYLAQLIGAGTNRRLTEFFVGELGDAHEDAGHEALVRAEVAAAGLELVRFDDVLTKVEFFDVSAVVHFLRKVLWTVPDFTAERYDAELRRMHELISAQGSFVSYSRRLLVEARKR
ncbi:MAG: class I SAM-dependent methyltransferase [Microbacteriaceae bacterium]|nr:class I SAM-dependent methyltransferase [Microbacteriaceae bacterium]MCL2793735.1 class I SAM-dependent methyltransferase [Microbacteriaceae bacterium]